MVGQQAKRLDRLDHSEVILIYTKRTGKYVEEAVHFFFLLSKLFSSVDVRSLRLWLSLLPFQLLKKNISI